MSLKREEVIWITKFQVESLYKAGYDDIAGDMRTGVTDVQTIR